MPRCFCQIYTHNNLTLSGMAAVWESTAGVWYNKVKIPLREVIAQIKEVTYVYGRNQSAERFLFQVFAGE